MTETAIREKRRLKKKVPAPSPSEELLLDDVEADEDDELKKVVSVNPEHLKGAIKPLGLDKKNRPIIKLCPTELPRGQLDYEKLLNYVTEVVESVEGGDYVVVYIHASSAVTPSFVWLRKAVRRLDQRQGKNMQALYVINATPWLRMVLTWTSKLTDKAFSDKLVYINNLEDIFTYIDASQLEVEIEEGKIKRDREAAGAVRGPTGAVVVTLHVAAKSIRRRVGHVAQSA